MLTKKGNLREAASLEEVGAASAGELAIVNSVSHRREPFLRIPPFPGARCSSLVAVPGPHCEPHTLAEALRRSKVGGSFWGAQPELPASHVLARSRVALDAAKQLFPTLPIVLWDCAGEFRGFVGATVISGECDPWHMLSGACALVTAPDDELRLVAALLGVTCYDVDPVARRAGKTSLDPMGLIAAAFSTGAFENPFTGETMDALAAVELCAFWRMLIDSNRRLAGGLGFAFWKQDRVAPLLWGGAKPFPFLRDVDQVKTGEAVAIWQAKTPPAIIAELERRQIATVEVEDGFLRSRGLGADCIPPLSITVDCLGAHFDPSRASELEGLIQNGQFDQPLLDRARELRRLIVQAGLGKYERGTEVLERPAGNRRHILVPGQVEDDRAVTTGGCGLVSNLDLLSRVREQAPEAYLLYKPHPDVLAGHRRGSIRDRDCLRFADEIVGELPISSLIDMVDEVHVNSSLAGFEALVRGTPVTTYGVPFYAGWGLTRDLGPVPRRRSQQRTIDELIAATLLLYPRYLDPVTGLPCPAEVVVARLSVEEEDDAGLVVGMRRLQGKLMRRLRSLAQ